MPILLLSVLTLPMAELRPLTPSTAASTFRQVQSEMERLDGSRLNQRQLNAAFDREGVAERARRRTRKRATHALDQPWSSFCTTRGRNDLVAALGHYFAHRRRDPAAWATADDIRIERLVRENYARGYFKLDDFRLSVRDMIAELISQEKVVRQQPCA